jgi:ABC-type transport system involved in cytochrome bd biosynthesis fused ATPase/permease subunit
MGVLSSRSFFILLTEDAFCTRKSIHQSYRGNRLASNLSNLIGYVGQNPFIFAGTIAENIKYGYGEVSEDEIRRAAQQACIDIDIKNMSGLQWPLQETAELAKAGISIRSSDE